MSDTKTKTKNLEFSVHLFLEEFWSNPGEISEEFCGHIILQRILRSSKLLDNKAGYLYWNRWIEGRVGKSSLDTEEVSKEYKQL